jgi:hypothetical protein
VDRRVRRLERRLLILRVIWNSLPCGIGRRLGLGRQGGVRSRPASGAGDSMSLNALAMPLLGSRVSMDAGLSCPAREVPRPMGGMLWASPAWSA